jgi:hypothetical protein
VEETMSSKKRWIAAVGAVTLVAGLLAVAVPAGAGQTGPPNGEDKPWPILQVMKTIGQASPPTEGTIDVPPETVFTILVTCEFPQNGADAQGDPFPDTLLTFDATGAPLSADQGGWQNLGDGYWTFQGPELKYKECSATETDVTPEPTALEVAYKCDASAAIVEPVVTEEEAEAAEGLVFGCVRPLPEGEYESSPPATDAAVQFTAFWDREACGIVNGREADASLVTRQFCQETGTLTVDNLDPGWVVVSPAAVVPIEIVPTFTG